MHKRGVCMHRAAGALLDVEACWRSGEARVCDPTYLIGRHRHENTALPLLLATQRDESSEGHTADILRCVEGERWRRRFAEAARVSHRRRRHLRQTHIRKAVAQCGKTQSCGEPTAVEDAEASLDRVGGRKGLKQA